MRGRASASSRGPQLLANGSALGVGERGIAMYTEAVRFADYVRAPSGRRWLPAELFAVEDLRGRSGGDRDPAVLIFGLPGIALIEIIPLIARCCFFKQSATSSSNRPAHASPASARAARKAMRESRGAPSRSRRAPARRAAPAVRAAGLRTAVLWKV